jgi:glutathione S-transferase
MVAYETASKVVLGLGPPDPSFVARGQQNFARFATVLNESLKGRAWLTGDDLTIADFSVAGLVPSAERMQLPVKQFPEVVRWYAALAALPAWRRALEVKNASMGAWQASHANNAKPELTLK